MKGMKKRETGRGEKLMKKEKRDERREERKI